MIVSTLKRMGWALLLLAIQVLVLDQVHPWGYGAPLLCPLLVITLPLGTARSEALLWGFGIGFVADIFAGTAGISSAAMTLIAFIQPPLLHDNGTLELSAVYRLASAPSSYHFFCPRRILLLSHQRHCHQHGRKLCCLSSAYHIG